MYLTPGVRVARIRFQNLFPPLFQNLFPEFVFSRICLVRVICVVGLLAEMIPYTITDAFCPISDFVDSYNTVGNVWEWVATKFNLDAKQKYVRACLL